jgi:hypothetical protein
MKPVMSLKNFFGVGFLKIRFVDEAFVWLQKAYDDRDDRLMSLKVDPFWDRLRSDPRYANLVRGIGL